MTDPLINAALEVRENAHAPFSKFSGRRGRMESGRIFTGCNVENATYGLRLCSAERVAILKAVSEGARKFTRVAVVADTDTLTPPCGIAARSCGNSAATSNW